MKKSQKTKKTEYDIATHENEKTLLLGENEYVHLLPVQGTDNFMSEIKLPNPSWLTLFICYHSAENVYNITVQHKEYTGKEFMSMENIPSEKIVDAVNSTRDMLKLIHGEKNEKEREKREKYEIYKLVWMIENNITLDDLITSLDELSGEICEEHSLGTEELFEEFEKQFTLKGGLMWPSYEEFCKNELYDRRNLFIKHNKPKTVMIVPANNDTDKT